MVERLSRVDHALHSVFPASTDFIHATEGTLGIKPVAEDSEGLLSSIAGAFYRHGTTESVTDESSKEFYSQLGKYENNKPIETAKERNTRLALDKVHEALSHVNTVLTVASDAEDRKELYQKRAELLDAGIAIANGESVRPPSSGVEGRYRVTKNKYAQETKERLQSIQ